MPPPSVPLPWVTVSSETCTASSVPGSISIAAVVVPAIVAPEATETLAPTLVRPIPVPAPFLSRSVSATEPATSFRLSAVPAAVVIEVWSTSTEVSPPLPTSASEAPVASESPRSLTPLVSVTVPVSVAVPLPSVGRVTVPDGGEMPKAASNVPAAPCPISSSPELRVNAPVYAAAEE